MVLVRCLRLWVLVLCVTVAQKGDKCDRIWIETYPKYIHVEEQHTISIHADDLDRGDRFKIEEWREGCPDDDDASEGRPLLTYQTAKPRPGPKYNDPDAKCKGCTEPDEVHFNHRVTESAMYTVCYFRKQTKEWLDAGYYFVDAEQLDTVRFVILAVILLVLVVLVCSLLAWLLRKSRFKTSWVYFLIRARVGRLGPRLICHLLYTMALVIPWVLLGLWGVLLLVWVSGKVMPIAVAIWLCGPCILLAGFAIIRWYYAKFRPSLTALGIAVACVVLFVIYEALLSFLTVQFSFSGHTLVYLHLNGIPVVILMYLRFTRSSTQSGSSLHITNITSHITNEFDVTCLENYAVDYFDGGRSVAKKVVLIVLSLIALVVYVVNALGQKPVMGLLSLIIAIATVIYDVNLYFSARSLSASPLALSIVVISYRTAFGAFGWRYWFIGQCCAFVAFVGFISIRLLNILLPDSKSLSRSRSLLKRIEVGDDDTAATVNRKDNKTLGIIFIIVSQVVLIVGFIILLVIIQSWGCDRVPPIHAFDKSHHQSVFGFAALILVALPPLTFAVYRLFKSYASDNCGVIVLVIVLVLLIEGICVGGGYLMYTVTESELLWGGSLFLPLAVAFFAIGFAIWRKHDYRELLPAETSTVNVDGNTVVIRNSLLKRICVVPCFLLSALCIVGLGYFVSSRNHPEWFGWTALVCLMIPFIALLAALKWFNTFSIRPFLVFCVICDVLLFVGYVAFMSLLVIKERPGGWISRAGKATLVVIFIPIVIVFLWACWLFRENGYYPNRKVVIGFTASCVLTAGYAIGIGEVHECCEGALLGLVLLLYGVLGVFLFWRHTEGYIPKWLKVVLAVIVVGMLIAGVVMGIIQHEVFRGLSASWFMLIVVMFLVALSNEYSVSLTMNKKCRMVYFSKYVFPAYSFNSNLGELVPEHAHLVLTLATFVMCWIWGATAALFLQPNEVGLTVCALTVEFAALYIVEKLRHSHVLLDKYGEYMNGDSVSTSYVEASQEFQSNYVAVSVVPTANAPHVESSLSTSRMSMSVMTLPPKELGDSHMTTTPVVGHQWRPEPIKLLAKHSRKIKVHTQPRDMFAALVDLDFKIADVYRQSTRFASRLLLHALLLARQAKMQDDLDFYEFLKCEGVDVATCNRMSEDEHVTLKRKFKKHKQERSKAEEEHRKQEREDEEAVRRRQQQMKAAEGEERRRELQDLEASLEPELGELTRRLTAEKEAWKKGKEEGTPTGAGSSSADGGSGITTVTLEAQEDAVRETTTTPKDFADTPAVNPDSENAARQHEEEQFMKKQEQEKKKFLQEELKKKRKQSQSGPSDDILTEALKTGGFDQNGKYVDATFDSSKLMPAHSTATWKRPSEYLESPSLFGNLHGDDVRQGQLGDCYFLSSLSVVAENASISIQKLFIDVTHADKGLYGVNFFKNGTWKLVVIDDRLPFPSNNTQYPLYAHARDPAVLWPALLEKAYAKLHVSYVNIEGGFVADALQDLTGGVGQVFKFTNDTVKQRLATGELFQDALAWAKAGHLMGASSLSGSDTEVSTWGIVLGHAYSILAVAEVDGIQMVKLRNPWGKTEWKGDYADHSAKWTTRLRNKVKAEIKDDGIFWMTFQDFVLHYRALHLCRLFPKNEWNSKVIPSKWDGTTAGGNVSLSTYVQNPQFLLEVTEPIQIFVVLVRDDKREGGDDDPPAINLRIQANKGKKCTNLRLGENISTSGVYSYDSSVVCETKLPPRDTPYTVVPSCFDAAVDWPFSIRFYSKGKYEVHEWKEHKTDIPERQPKIYTFQGSWDSSTAGGCSNHTSFIRNPQWLLQLPTHSEWQIHMVVQQQQPGHRLHPINLAVVKNGGRRAPAIYISQQVATSGAYVASPEVLCETTLKGAHSAYTVIASTFEPYQLGQFDISFKVLNLGGSNDLCEITEAPPPQQQQAQPTNITNNPLSTSTNVGPGNNNSTQQSYYYGEDDDADDADAPCCPFL